MVQIRLLTAGLVRLKGLSEMVWECTDKLLVAKRRKHSLICPLSVHGTVSQSEKKNGFVGQLSAYILTH